MSLPHTLSTIIGSASRAVSTGSVSNGLPSISLSLISRLRLTTPVFSSNTTTLSICSNCLRSLGTPGPTVFVRGKKKLAKKVGIKVRFLKDIPRYGPKGSIMVVAPGRMRTIWYQRGEAEYLTLEKERSLGKYTVVERDPGYKPLVEKKEDKSDVWDGVVKEQLLTPNEAIKILTTILPSTIRFYRSTITPTTNALHGSVTATDIANAVKLIASASAMKDANRVVVSAENISVGTVEGTARVKELGEYEIAIGFRGVDEVVRRTVTVVREEAEEGDGGGADAGRKPVVPQGGSIFGSAGGRTTL